MTNWLGIECEICHKREVFPDPTSAEIAGWMRINGRWYCPNCDWRKEVKNETN